MQTTLNKIKAKKPCLSGWKKLLKHLGKTGADAEPLKILTILESNGLDDALWALQAVDGHEKEKRIFAVECARQVQYLMTDPRSLAALGVAERFACGKATLEELAVANDAAYNATIAAYNATIAAYNATIEANDADYNATIEANDADYDAARAVYDADYDAAYNAVYDAARAVYDAASAASADYDAAYDAAHAAAHAAANDAASAAYNAAYNAARAEQEACLRRILS